MKKKFKYPSITNLPYRDYNIEIRQEAPDEFNYYITKTIAVDSNLMPFKSIDEVIDDAKNVIDSDIKMNE